MKTNDSLILEQGVEIEVLPISDESNGKMCEICLTQYSTGNDLYAHMILDHDGGTFQARKHENNIDISEQWKKRKKLEPNIEMNSGSLLFLDMAISSSTSRKVARLG